jgi:hypothetical protein
MVFYNLEGWYQIESYHQSMVIMVVHGDKVGLPEKNAL